MASKLKINSVKNFDGSSPGSGRQVGNDQE